MKNWLILETFKRMIKSRKFLYTLIGCITTLLSDNFGLNSEDFPSTVRSREALPAAERDFKFIPFIEIYVAIKKRTQGTSGVDWAELSKVIAKDFGYKQCSQNMVEYFKKAYSLYKK